MRVCCEHPLGTSNSYITQRRAAALMYGPRAARFEMHSQSLRAITPAEWSSAGFTAVAQHIRSKCLMVKKKTSTTG